jgi:pimeloyl-ACP methyl ester carboxylesterase
MPTLGRFHYLEALPPGVSAAVSRPRGAAGEIHGTLVLIHGFPLSARMREPQLGLADRGWRIIVPSLRGFDGTAASPVATSVDDFAGDVIDLIDGLHIENAVIGGLSMGGYITFAMFRHAPGYFRGMILADTRSQADTPEGVEGRRKMIATVREQGAAAAAEAMLPKLLGDSTRRNSPEIAEQVRAMILATPVETIIGAITALMTRPDATPLLAQIHCPALVIVGDQDVLTPPDLSRQMHQGVRGSELAVIADAGHMPNMEQPAAFNDVLARFLDRSV